MKRRTSVKHAMPKQAAKSSKPLLKTPRPEPGEAEWDKMLDQVIRRA
jgi:hypothetical protein